MAILAGVNYFGTQTFPSSGSSGWLTAPLSDLKVFDNSGITIISPHLLDQGRIFGREQGRGTILRLRMKYSGAVSSSPVIQIFGRFNSTDYWQPIRNKNDVNEITLTVDTATDVTDGANSYTSPNNSDHSLDCDGYDEFIFAVKTETNAASAILQVRFI